MPGDIYIHLLLLTILLGINYMFHIAKVAIEYWRAFIGI